jgi:hypothetical protein
MADPRALHGDGINFAFFNLLWSKSDDGAKQVVEPSSAGQGGKAGKTSSILRVPDTVVFLFGQPHEWYFTSKNLQSDGSEGCSHLTMGCSHSVLHRNVKNNELGHSLKFMFRSRKWSGPVRTRVWGISVIQYMMSSEFRNGRYSGCTENNSVS